MAVDYGLKQQAMATLEKLPNEALDQAVAFLEYLNQRFSESKKYKPVALGGLWRGVEVSDEDIAEVRKEMWGNLGERVQ